MPSAPGWSLVTTPYYYNGSADKSKTFQKGDTLVVGVKSTVALMLFQPGYSADTKILGGQPYVGLGWGPGYNRTSVDITLTRPALNVGRADSITGGTDLYPFASLAWTKGNDNWMTYLTGDIPVGAYQSNRLANLGIGHGAIDAGGGYTYLNDKTGLEFSAVAGSPTTGRTRTPTTRTESTPISTGPSPSSFRELGGWRCGLRVLPVDR